MKLNYNLSLKISKSFGKATLCDELTKGRKLTKGEQTI